MSNHRVSTPARVLDSPHSTARALAPSLLLTSFVAIYLTEWWVSLVSIDRADIDVVSWAVAVDLVIGVPLLVYCIGVRWLGWKWITVVPAAVLGLMVSGWLMPAARDGVLADLEWVLIPAELALLGFIGWRASLGWRRLRAHREATGEDLWRVLGQAAEDVAGKGVAARVLAYEIAVQTYAFGFWRRPLPESTGQRFSIHRRSGVGLLMGGILIAATAEIVPVHFLIHHFLSPTLAWIATVLSIYGAVWILGHWQAVRHQPVLLDAHRLSISVGLLWRVTVPRTAIAAWRRIPASEEVDPKALPAFPAGRPSHLLELTEPITAEGPYGLTKTVDSIALFVDDTERFEASLEPND